VTKKDIATMIAHRSGVRQVQALAIVQGVFDSIVQTLASGGRIELRNFGVFEVKRRKPRKARNPRTREAVEVPAKLVVAFKPGREMDLPRMRLRVPAPESGACVFPLNIGARSIRDGTSSYRPLMALSSSGQVKEKTFLQVGVGS
jgi:nucleoid DNA-binding protein